MYSVSGSASANWLKGSAQISLSFHEDPEDFEIGDDWGGQGETHVESSGGFFSLGDGHGPSVVKAEDDGSIYIRIKERTDTFQISGTVQLGGGMNVQAGTKQGAASVGGTHGISVSGSYSRSTKAKYTDIQGRSSSWTSAWAWKFARAKAVFEGSSYGPYLAAY